ncbi:hypothetical protein L7F22_058770 [Adiantum nelumboides]|nr:hypothetical protein [Adiantum nelumboides]
MSGAQGAQPKGSYTATTYSMAKDDQAGAHPAKEKLREEDSPSVPVVFESDQAGTDAAGHGGPTFGNKDDPKSTDMGVSGTG